MIKKLIKTLFFERGEMYTVTNGRRILMARCEPKIEIYEHRQNIKAVGMRNYSVKKYHIVVVLCSDLDFTRDIDEKFLRSVSRFEMTADIQRDDGIFEKVFFEGLQPVKIEFDGEWEFEIENQPELIKKFMEL